MRRMVFHLVVLALVGLCIIIPARTNTWNECVKQDLLIRPSPQLRPFANIGFIIPFPDDRKGGNITSLLFQVLQQNSTKIPNTLQNMENHSNVGVTFEAAVLISEQVSLFTANQLLALGARVIRIPKQSNHYSLLWALLYWDVLLFVDPRLWLVGNLSESVLPTLQSWRDSSKLRFASAAPTKVKTSLRHLLFAFRPSCDTYRKVDVFLRGKKLQGLALVTLFYSGDIGMNSTFFPAHWIREAEQKDGRNLSDSVFVKYAHRLGTARKPHTTKTTEFTGSSWIVLPQIRGKPTGPTFTVATIDYQISGLSPAASHVMAMSKSLYCTLHGHSWNVYYHLFDHARHPVWSKVLVLLDLLQKEHTADYIWLLDFDTIIFNYSVQLADLLLHAAAARDPRKDDSIDIILSKDCNGINAGSILFRNSAWTKVFAKKWFLTNSSDIPKMDIWKEQASLMYLFHTDQDVRDHTVFIPQKLFNAYGHSCGYKFRKNDFLIHFAGDKASADTWAKQWLHDYTALRHQMDSLLQWPLLH